MAAALSPEKRTIQWNTKQASSQPMVYSLVSGLKYESWVNLRVWRRALGKQRCVSANKARRLTDNPTVPVSWRLRADRM